VSSTSGSAGRSSGRTILAVILGIIALIFIVVAIIYVAEPAKSLLRSGAHRRLHRAPPAPGRGFVRHRHRLRGRGLVRPGVQTQATGRHGKQQGKLARGAELNAAYLRPGRLAPATRDGVRALCRPTRLRAPFEALPSLLAPSSLVSPGRAGALWLAGV